MCISLPIEYSCFYRLAETTYPKIGRIFVFNTLTNALNFSGGIAGSIVLEGIATDIGKPKYVCCQSHYKYELMAFWGKRNRSNIKPCPHGTLTCSSFTPERIVIDNTY